MWTQPYFDDFIANLVVLCKFSGIDKCMVLWLKI